MLTNNVIIPAEEANRIIRELDQNGADLLSILTMRGDIAMGRLTMKKGDAVLRFAEQANAMAAKLATQFATLGVAEAVTKEPPRQVKATKAPKKKRTYAPMEDKVRAPLRIGSGSFASMLMPTH